MSSKLILKETEITEIRSLYGLINEQNYTDKLIPAKGYQIIEDIEGNMGTATFDKDSNGYVPDDTPHRGDELESRIKSILSQQQYKKIYDNWEKIDPLFRTQIYSYMFQSGSEGVDNQGSYDSSKNRRWLAGLAQAIDDKIDRLKIVVNNDPNEIQKAIDTISTAIIQGKINSYYEKYKQILQSQYRNLSNPKTKYTDEQWEAIYEIAWKNRPQIIEDMWNGATIENILKSYFPQAVKIKKDDKGKYYAENPPQKPSKPNDKDKVTPPTPLSKTTTTTTTTPSTPLSTTQTAKQPAVPGVPIELNDKKGVQDFQDWLDKNYPGWHPKHKTIAQVPTKGWGSFDDVTKNWWNSLAKYKFMEENPNYLPKEETPQEKPAGTQSVEVKPTSRIADKRTRF